MLAFGPLAFGQSTPATTTWQKFPTPAVSVTPPAPSPVPPPAMPGTPQPGKLQLGTSQPGTSLPGSRVVVFTKPAGELRPVQAVDSGKAPADVKKAPDVKPTAQPADLFNLRTDQELAAEMDVLRDLAAKQKDYAEKMKDYERELERYKNKLRPDEPKPPSKPIPVGLLSVDNFQPAVQVKPGYAPAQAKLEPAYVVHRRLYFEEKNSDRYGWDLGLAQPFVSAAHFYKDVLFWPSHIASNFSERYDTSAGKCMPGNPVAYYLYPPNITLRGGVVEAGLVIGTVALLP